MKLFERSLAVTFFMCCLNFMQPLLANNAIYEQRRQAYIDTALANFGSDGITLQAYRGVPVDSAALYSLLNGIAANETSDFAIVKLVRVMFLAPGQYDTIIMPVLNTIPFWLTKSDTIRGYWSENHMSQWMSSDWLLHEKFGKPVDADLDNRLRHYLHLKIDYGFYEFFSSVYAPYCLTGLLNLADFSQDVEIKNLATQAAQRLLKDLLMLTNDKGVFYPVAGRNYYSKYGTPYGQNHNNLIYLLTGMGQAPLSNSHAGGFLASTSIPLDTVISSWTPDLDLTYHIGHSLDTGFILNSGLSHLDKVLFQWSSGAYFHPQVAAETAQLLIDSNLWRHVDFAPFRQFSSFSVPTIVNIANVLNVASMSSLNVREDVVIYKHKSITLASVKDFWKGKVGFQQYPCMANVGTTAVYTGSGVIDPDWDNRSANNANENLPYVAQKKNLALLMYRPEPKSELLPFRNDEVALHFKTADFDEVTQDSMWLLGRHQHSYVAVRRHCVDTINSVPGCYMSNGQSWAIMVGDSSLYGSFTNFKNVVHNSQFEERWYIDTANSKSVYYAKVVVDTVTIDYAWAVDTTIATGISNLNASNQYAIYPNPAANTINIDLTSSPNQAVVLTATNLLGQQVYQERVIAGGIRPVNTAEWNEGIYLISVETKTGKEISKLIINR